MRGNRQEQMEECFRTNFHGPLNIVRAFLPFLRERGTGTLVLLSSQAAWHVDISAGAYCASKFALSGADLSLPVSHQHCWNSLRTLC